MPWKPRSLLHNTDRAESPARQAGSQEYPGLIFVSETDTLYRATAQPRAEGEHHVKRDLKPEPPHTHTHMASSGTPLGKPPLSQSEDARPDAPLSLSDIKKVHCVL